MDQLAVRVENLSKVYRLGEHITVSETLFQQLGVLALKPINRMLGRAPSGEAVPLLKALDNISFDVPTGQTLGIIGHNGAGKSTLLKILSRITEPSSGRIGVRGRMASLLEVGTGFHPDLSGRDNVFLNAAILGMPKREIQRRFDDIVAFAEMESFIDTPIKHYSTGMRVRLAFAVAAHLDPDILIIDEVLAVGDAEFQKRCLNRIEAVGESGRTVLFVSHQLNTVSRLCQRTLVMDHGHIVHDAGTLESIRYYNERLGMARSYNSWTPEESPSRPFLTLHEVEILLDGVRVDGAIDVRRDIDVRIRFSANEEGHELSPCLQIFDSSGNWVFVSLDPDPAWQRTKRPKGDYESLVTIPGNLLNEGMYSVSVSIGTHDVYYKYCFAHDCVAFSVYDSMEPGNTRGGYTGELPGPVRPALRWQSRRIT